MSNGKLVMKSKSKEEEDTEEYILQNQMAGEYKGIFYGDNSEQRYYENGAHFQYKDLYRRLEKLLTILTPNRRGENSDNLAGFGEEVQNVNKTSRNNTKHTYHHERNTLNFSQNTMKTREKVESKGSAIGNTQLYSNSNKPYNFAEIKEIRKINHYLNNGNYKQDHGKPIINERPVLLSSLNIKSSDNFDFSKTTTNNLFKKIQPEKYDPNQRANFFNYNNKISKMNLKENKITYIENTDSRSQMNTNVILNNNEISKAKHYKIIQNQSDRKDINYISSYKYSDLNNLDNHNHQNKSELFRFISSAIDRKNDLTIHKSVKGLNALDRKISSYSENEPIKAQISYEVLPNTGKISEMLINKAKSRNFQTTVGKGNILQTDKVQTYSSLNYKFNKTVIKDNTSVSQMKSISNIDYNISNANNNRNQSNSSLSNKLITNTLNPSLNNHTNIGIWKKKENSLFSILNQNSFNKKELSKVQTLSNYLLHDRSKYSSSEKLETINKNFKIDPKSSKPILIIDKGTKSSSKKIL